ncbi:hypothetical protein MBLNU459_g4974t1 [Dothideomycetes sp. NU459]
MSLSFGLNAKSKPAASAPPIRQKKAAIFDDDQESEPEEQSQKDVFAEELTEFDGSKRPSRPRPVAAKPSKPVNKLRAGAIPAKPPVRKDKALGDEYTDLSAERESKKHASTAETLDSSIYDYDAFHDVHTTISSARKAADKQDALERKPKYINSLLDAAARRKQDQLIAREKLLQKEREAEGDEFADKEKFVTSGYKKQQEETRRLEEAEKKKLEEEEKKRREGGGGMQGFYRSVMDESEKRHREAMEAAERLEKSGGVEPVTEGDRTKTDIDLAAEMRAKGVNVHINDEGQVTDKRQLLSAGLNIGPSGNSSDKHAADHLKTSARAAQQPTFHGRGNDKQAMRERQTRMLEQQLEASAKRKAEEEAEEQESLARAAKSRKTETDISSAKERYLARKREAEAAKKAA